MIDSTLYIRSHTATIKALYDARQVQFKYVNSTNLDYGLVRCLPKSHVGPTSNLVKRGNCDVGGREIHRNYNSWVNNLANDLRAQLSRRAFN